MQLSLVWKRKKFFAAGELEEGERATSVLSLNRFAASFIAFFAMFLYGLTLEHFNHYIVWPRTIALALILGILFEIQHDRRDSLSRGIFYGGLICFLISVILAFSQYRIMLTSSGVSQTFVVFTVFVFGQGALHQILKIRRSGKTGALSLRMHQLFFLKDVSSIAFACAMSLEQGWPVLLLHGVSLSVQLVTMYHFYWVKVSPLACRRREA